MSEALNVENRMESSKQVYTIEYDTLIITKFMMIMKEIKWVFHLKIVILFTTTDISNEILGEIILFKR